MLSAYDDESICDFLVEGELISRLIANCEWLRGCFVVRVR